MGKKRDKKKVFVNQLKTLENLEQKIDKLIADHSRRGGSHLGVAFRVVIDPNESTLY